jgi:aquaporin rerated protein, invertebrate
MKLPQKLLDKACMVLAEVIGTGMLMFFGCMGTVGWGGVPAGIGAPINFGLTVMIIIQTFGHISLAILNPAVTVCAVVNDMISFKVSVYERNQ